MSKKPIINFYKFTKKVKTHNPHYKDTLIDLPFRMTIVGGSGAGKTLFLCELIHRMSQTFEEIIICVRSKHEPLYELLESKGKGLIKFYENKIPDVDEFKDKLQRFIIFDDLILSKNLQAMIGEYYIRGRKFQISCAYLSQSFYLIPKIIRQQSNYLILKKLGSFKDIKMIIREYSLSVGVDQLMKLYQEIIKNKLDFLMIDLQNDDYKYRYNFVPINIPEE